jgi:DNA-binding IclR family transcriptional regulator
MYLYRRVFMYTEHTISNLKMMKDQLELVFKRAYAFNGRENDTEGFWIGAPVLNRTQRPTTAITVSGPLPKFG